MESVPRRIEAPSTSARRLDVKLLRGSLELDARHGIAAAVDNGLDLVIAANGWRDTICGIVADVAAVEVARRAA